MNPLIRRFLSSALALGMLFSLTACGKDTPGDAGNESISETTAETTVPEETYVVELSPEQEQARKAAESLSFLSVDDGDILTALRSDGKVIAFPLKPDDFYQWRFDQDLLKGYYGNEELSEEEYAQQLEYFREGLEESALTHEVFQWENIIDTVSVPDAVFGLTSQGTILAAGDGKQRYRDIENWTDIVSISSFDAILMGIRSDGSVAIDGTNAHSIRNAVQDWTGIKDFFYNSHSCLGVKEDGSLSLIGGFQGKIDLSALNGAKSYAMGYAHILGLREDGTVAASALTGLEEDALALLGLDEAESWTDIVAITSGLYSSIGLKSDGTVEVCGAYSDEFKAKIKALKDVESIEIGDSQLQDKIYGLKKDGSIFTLDMFDLQETNEKINHWLNVYKISANKKHVVGLRTDGTAVAYGDNTDGQCNVESWKDLVDVAAGPDHSLGLKSDGTAVAVGNDENGATRVEEWTGVKMISAKEGSVGVRFDGSVLSSGCWVHVDDFSDKNVISVLSDYKASYGICDDGTLVFAGNRSYGGWEASELTNVDEINSSGNIALLTDGTMWTASYVEMNADLSTWADIVDIASDGSSILAVKSDGTVLAAWSSYREDEGQFAVEEWSDITTVAQSYYHSLGLRSDGTVVAAGDNSSGQCDVSEWTDIVSIVADYDNSFGIKSDGTVVIAGALMTNEYDQETRDQILSWTDIVQIQESNLAYFGLRSDGTIAVVPFRWAEFDVPDVTGWTDIVQFSAGDEHVLGLKSDGTVVAAGNNDFYQCQVNGF